MRDVQSERDLRELAIDRVGIRDLYYPIDVLDLDHNLQHTVARVSMAVSLPQESRGTHMSRFVEVLEKTQGQINFHNMEEMVQALRKHLKANRAEAEFCFPYFIRRKAPVSGALSLTCYQVTLWAEGDAQKFDLVTTVEVPIQTVCPCSREISDFGAHNQRAHVSISARMRNFVWIEELIKIAEKSASAPVFSLLKREDEKYLTEKAYQNPRFVEDVIREAALLLEEESRIVWYRVSVVSHESIHNHDAFASLEKDRRTADSSESKEEKERS